MTARLSPQWFSFEVNLTVQPLDEADHGKQLTFGRCVPDADSEFVR
jgi:hypothetical protein